MKVFVCTPEGVIVPCSHKGNIYRPLVKGGYMHLKNYFETIFQVRRRSNEEAT